MRLVKLVAFLSLWMLFFVSAVLVHLGLSICGRPRRWRWISRLINRNFAAMLKTILNIRVGVDGEAQSMESGGCLIVSNHLGYVDGIVLGSIFPVIYVSKKEVRRWPLIGQWTALCGTIFIDRKRKDKIPLLVGEIARKLSQKANVLMFPEGTSTNGKGLLPFQSAPFAAPIRAGAAIVPVTLTYQRISHQPLSNQNKDLIYWYGDMEFLGHFWNLLTVQSIEVLVKIHPKIDTSRYQNDSSGRKALSQACYESVSAPYPLSSS